LTAGADATRRPATPAAGLVLVGTGICSVQFGSAIAAKLFAHVGSSGVGLLRLASAAILLTLVWRPRIAGRRADELLVACGFGCVLAAMNLCFYAALHRIPLGIAVTIEFVGPLAVAIGSSRRRVDLVWVLLAVLGILALTHGSTHHLSGLGILLALLAGAFWATYILLASRIGRAFEGGSGLAVAMCTGAVVALPFGIADGGSHLLSAHALLVGSVIGLLSSAIPYSCEIEALRRIDRGLFAVLMSLEPAVAALVGLIVLGQSLGARAVVGVVLVVAASAGASVRSRRTPVDV
jgi:inner membrane transporter RhtA